MQKLKFVAVEGHSVGAQGQGDYLQPGSPKRYVGYKFDYPFRRYVMDDKPFETDTSDRELSKRLKRACKKGSLYPYDEETANYCGVDYEDLYYNEQEQKWQKGTAHLENAFAIEEFYPRKKRTKRK